MKYLYAFLLLIWAFRPESASAQCPPGSQVKPRAVVTDVRCYQGSDGAITIAVDEGTPPFSYQWSPPAGNTPTITGLSASSPSRIYSVTITDALGCSAVLSNILVKQPDPFVYNVTIHNVTCFGGSNGALDFFLTGGTPPYSYVWTNVATNTVIATTEDISNLPVGIYGLTVTDANGCSGGIFYIIAQADSMNVRGSVTNVTCPAGRDGAISLNVTGGTGTKTYVWSSGENSKNISNKPAGNYTVTVTDVNGCIKIHSFNISQPSPFNAASSITSITCNGFSDGVIDITASGGTPPYSFSWSNGQSAEDISNLAAGQYCVTLTDSKNCVSNPFCFTVNEPEEISITADITNASCPGESDGVIDVTVSGGTPPYTYHWTGGVTSEDLSNLSPGLYSVTAADASGCTAEATYSVRSENLLIISLGITQPLCGQSNGSVTVTISGGTPPLIIQWSNGQSGASINNLVAGSYTVTVTDAHGCSTSQTAVISNVNELSVSGNVTNTVCGSGNTGAIDISITGGTLPYTYQWSNGAATEDISGLAEGSYTVTVTDSTACQEVMTFAVTEESGLSVSESASPPNCGQTDGSITITVTGGSPPYSYAWSSGQSTPAISALAAGVYTVTVTDANGCEEIKTVTLADNAGPQIAINKTDITCSNPTGTLEVVITSGTGPFTIMWSAGETTTVITGLEAGTYAVTVTGSDGCTGVAVAELTPAPGIIMEAAMTDPSCNGSTDGAIDVTVMQGRAPFSFTWSTGENTEDISGIGAGTYSVTVTDASGCSATTAITLDEPEEISAMADTLDQPQCSGESTGSINITVTGGTAPYNYDWSNGDTTEELTGIPTGQYCVVITDAIGCVSDTFCFFLNEPEPLQFSPSITQPTCNGEDNGAISIAVSGGTPPYTYQWSMGDTSQNISNLTAGSYSLTATDANGCTADGIFTIDEPDSLIATVQDSSDVTCNGANDGSLTILVTGGSAPYDFDWSNGDSLQTITGLPPGTYRVTVTDASGCKDSTDAVIIDQPDLLVISASITPPECNIPGNIDLTISGGMPPYSYLWSTGDTTSRLDSIMSSGVFEVTVTDSNGCTATASFAVDGSPIMDVLIEINQPLRCHGDSSGVLCAQVTGVPGPYLYQWSTGHSTQCVSGLPAGTYSVTVANGSGCSAYMNGFELTEPQPITISPIIASVTCYGSSDGSIIIGVLGGTPPYFYQWSSGDTGNFADSLPAGVVTVTVTDANECRDTLAITVPQPPPFDFNNSQVVNTTCDTTTDGSITVHVTGGTPPYTFLWDDETSGPSINSLAEGIYSVTVTDFRGCTASHTFTIDGPACNNLPIAMDDTTQIFVCRNATVDIAVLTNDYDPDGDAIFVSQIWSQPLFGSAQLNSDQTITYAPAISFTGIDSLEYVICESGTHPSLCDTGKVIVVVLPCRPNITIPTGYSPNGDGINDGFIIPGIEFYPDNELLIFNRWGNKVIEFKRYQNQWRGENADGEPLPDGTYYFILKLNDEANTTYTGYVVIHR